MTSLSEKLTEIYNELNAPSTDSFAKALARRGIKARRKDIEEFIRSKSERQVIAPPPKYTGNIVSTAPDDRWAADLIAYTSKPVETKDGTYTHVLVVQDIFTRFVWAKALKSVSDTSAAFADIMHESKRQCRRLDTDGGAEWVSRTFKNVVATKNIRHVVKDKNDLNAIGTVDAAIKNLKRAIKRRRQQQGGTWLDQLDAAVKGYNSTVHSATDAPPNDVNDDITFSLKIKAAEQLADNSEQIKKRQERLEKDGAYRVHIPKEGGLKRRADATTWSKKIHYVDSFPAPGKVKDTEGNVTLTKLTKPVPADSSQIDSKKPKQSPMLKELRPYAKALFDMLGFGMPISQASKKLKDKRPNFGDKLRAQNISFTDFIKKFPDLFKIRKNRIVPVQASGPLDAFK